MVGYLWDARCRGCSFREMFDCWFQCRLSSSLLLSALRVSLPGQDWNQRRQAPIHTGHAGNLNVSRLTATQCQEVAGVLSRLPSD